MVDAIVDNDDKTMKQVSNCGYDNIKRKGRGAYGYVYQVLDKYGEYYAFKYILHDESYKLRGLDNLHEIDIISRINHPYIIHTERIITRHICNIEGLALLFPLADRSLYDILSTNMTTEEKLPILYQIASGIDFLHQNNILHLDIKVENVILRGIGNYHPYLIDFGLSLFVDNAAEGEYDQYVKVTLDYRPPELLLEYDKFKYNAAVDIWSFGILMLYLISEQKIYNVDFLTVKNETLYSLILQLFTHPDYILDRLLVGVYSNLKHLCKDFLKKVLQIDPTKRLTAQQMCNHPLFDRYRTNPRGYISNPPLNHDYAEDNREAIKVLLNWVVHIYATAKAKLLFLASDLYIRSSPSYKKRKPEERMCLAATCIWMAAKLTNTTEILVHDYIIQLNNSPGVPKYNIREEQILETEIEVVHVLNGILYLSPLYDICSNGDELGFCLREVILSRNLTMYSSVLQDLPNFISLLKSNITVISLPSKNITIAQLNIFG